jgi:hypothetical protein
MQLMAIPVFGLLMLSNGAVRTEARSQTWVVIDVAGQERVAFVPQPEPYTTGAPAVRVPVPSGLQVRLGSGEPVDYFEFTGWHDAGAVRVVARALPPQGRNSAPRAEGSSTARGRHERHQVATFRVRVGESLSADQLQSLGMPTVALRLAER